jgi:hypothetical protein
VLDAAEGIVVQGLPLVDTTEESLLGISQLLQRFTGSIHDFSCFERLSVADRIVWLNFGIGIAADRRPRANDRSTRWPLPGSPVAGNTVFL